MARNKPENNPITIDPVMFYRIVPTAPILIPPTMFPNIKFLIPILFPNKIEKLILDRRQALNAKKPFINPIGILNIFLSTKLTLHPKAKKRNIEPIIAIIADP
eukprot:GHVR01073293.1.p1 GENE.GHVR01073293.1~~GHVR01073293.1.p1  ORF type:complete len:103 (-),score=3.51 GHVR01073293.1:20-328(-)